MLNLNQDLDKDCHIFTAQTNRQKSQMCLRKKETMKRKKESAHKQTKNQNKLPKNSKRNQIQQIVIYIH